MSTVTEKKVLIDKDAFAHWSVPEISTANDYYPFGMLMPGRNYEAQDAYRFGFNGKQNDNDLKGQGVVQNFGKRMYDSRLGRFLNIDPISNKYPSWSPYSFAGDNPIEFIDWDGLAKEKPKVVGTTKGVPEKMTDDEIVTKLDANKASETTGLSNDFMKDIVSKESACLNLYDKDGNTGSGGNTTIGIGHMVHEGAIGSDQYDADAVTKESAFKDGITLDKAFELFVSDLSSRVKEVKQTIKNKDAVVEDMNVLSVLVDIYFNKGTAPLKSAVDIYKEKGAQGLKDALTDGTIVSPSEERKKFEIGLLDKSISSTNASAQPTEEKKTPDEPPPSGEEKKKKQ